MRINLKSIYKAIIALLKRVKVLVYYFTHFNHIIGQKSYYPEKEHKSKYKIFTEQVAYILSYGEINDSYYVLGLDVQGACPNEYLSYSQYKQRRDKLNLTQPVNYVCLLRNKSLFSILGRYWGFPVIQNLAIYHYGVLRESYYKGIEEILSEHKHLFIKPIDAKKGQSVFSVDFEDQHIVINDKQLEINDFLIFLYDLSKTTELLIQDRIIQHPSLSELHTESVNTIRVVTINHLHSSNPEDVILVGAELRIGTGLNHTDNISVGGIKIGIMASGRLCEYGFYKEPYGTKATIHPDSGIVFKDYQIPFYSSAIEMCKSFHAKLKDIHIIGWDIAITTQGPVFIEGNDSCGTDFQVLYGPMRVFYDNYLPRI